MRKFFISQSQVNNYTKYLSLFYVFAHLLIKHRRSWNIYVILINMLTEIDLFVCISTPKLWCHGDNRGKFINQLNKTEDSSTNCKMYIYN